MAHSVSVNLLNENFSSNVVEHYTLNTKNSKLWFNAQDKLKVEGRNRQTICIKIKHAISLFVSANITITKRKF